MADPLPISVVIPAHNRESMIQTAVGSVRAQTRRPAEIIVVDDGSTDRTGTIAQTMGASVIRQTNQGPSAARNAGILAATQPWIAFLDSDDVWLPAKLELQWAAAQEWPGAGVVFSDYAIERDGEIPVPSYLAFRNVHFEMSRLPGKASGCCDRASLCREFLEKNFIMASAPLIRRDLLISAGLFDTELRYCEDYDLHLRLLTISDFVLVDRPLVHYRFHDANASKGVGKNDLGILMVAERVFAQPQKYPSGAAGYFHRRHPRDLKRAGVNRLRVGDFESAKQYLRTSLRRRFSVSAYAWYCSALAFGLAGPSFHYALRMLWRKRFKLPFLRDRSTFR